MPRLTDLAPEIAAAIDQLMRDQHQVATRAQLCALGLPRHHVTTQLKARRWQEMGAVVVVLHNGPLTKVQSWWAAVLSAEGPAALAARTAAEAGGLSGWEAEVIHVLVRRGAKVNDVPGLQMKVH